MGERKRQICADQLKCSQLRHLLAGPSLADPSKDLYQETNNVRSKIVDLLLSCPGVSSIVSVDIVLQHSLGVLFIVSPQLHRLDSIRQKLQQQVRESQLLPVVVVATPQPPR